MPGQLQLARAIPSRPGSPVGPEHHYLTAGPRCTLCPKDHLTTDHQCPVKGCRVGKGHPCPYRAAKCANCGEAHWARADACAAKREARLAARGWRSPPPPRREREAAAPKAPVVETPAAQEGAEEGGTEAGAQEEGGSAQEGEVVELEE